MIHRNQFHRRVRGLLVLVLLFFPRVSIDADANHPTNAQSLWAEQSPLLIVHSRLVQESTVWLPTIRRGVTLVRGRVWHDANANGQREEDELGIADVAVELWAHYPSHGGICPDGGCRQQADTDVTNRNGDYLLEKTHGSNVNYSLVITPPVDYPFVTVPPPELYSPQDTVNVDVGFFEGGKIWLPTIQCELAVVRG